MLSKENLDNITWYLRNHVFRNGDVMFSDGRLGDDDNEDLVDIIASLHNYLYEAVTGKRYDYWFHWVNKIGAGVNEDFFETDEEYLKEISEE